MPDNNANPERKQRILEAAAKLIAHYGYDKTTVSDIAEEAGISKGAVYLHYKGKEELFDALIMHEGEKMLEVMMERLETDEEAGSIFALYQHAIVASYSSPLILALMRRDAKVLGDMARRVVHGEIGVQGDFIRHEMVTQLQAANVIRRDLDADVVAHVMALVKVGFLLVNDYVPEQDVPPLDAVGKALGEILERGLAPEGGADKKAGKAALEHILHMLGDMLKLYKETHP